MKRMPNLEFHEVAAARWGDFERLFESRGGPKNCWCMVWRAGAKTTKGPDRKAAIRQYVCNDMPSGCSAIPKVSPLHGARSPRGQHTVTLAVRTTLENVLNKWSLVCFFIRRELRGQGLTKQVIEAAVQHAEKRGATVVEAYPVDPGSPSYRFMGYVQTFIAAGFREVGRAGTRRHVMRRELCR